MCWLCAQDLKGKILVKGKKEGTAEKPSSSSSDLSSSDEEAGGAEGQTGRRPEDETVGTPPPPAASAVPAAPGILLCNVVALCVFVPSQPAVSKLSPELSALVVYTRSVPFKGFEQAAKSPATNMSSFSESEALRHAKDSGTTCACQ